MAERVNGGAATIYLGPALIKRLDDQVGEEIAKVIEGKTPSEVAEATRRRGSLPSRSSVVQQALIEYLDRREHEHVYSTDPPHQCVAVPGCTMTSGQFLADVHAQATEDLRKLP